MSNYLRKFREGGTYFFTVVTHRRRKLFSRHEGRLFLRKAIEKVQQEQPFEIPAFVLMPEHLIRDREDFANHMDYIHYNPVKHNLVQCPHHWEYSSFHRWVKEGAYRDDWYCDCHGVQYEVPNFGDIGHGFGE